jgi:hypothetical protein
LKLRNVVPLLSLAVASCAADLPLAASGPVTAATPEVNPVASTKGFGRCKMTVELTDAIAGVGARCWFRARYHPATCGRVPPAWRVSTSDAYLQVLSSCQRPVTPSEDDHGPCAFVAPALGEPFSIVVTAPDGATRTVSSEYVEGKGCATSMP